MNVFDIVISHGGAGVLHNCVLQAAVPILCPIFGDQFKNVTVIEKLKIGVGLRLEEICKAKDQINVVIQNIDIYKQNILKYRIKVDRECKD